MDHGCAGLVPCGNCGQILSTADVSIHDEHHIQELLADFPAFGKTVELKSSNGQWGSSKIVAPNKTTKPSVKTAESQKWGGGTINGSIVFLKRTNNEGFKIISLIICPMSAIYCLL